MKIIFQLKFQNANFSQQMEFILEFFTISICIFLVKFAMFEFFSFLMEYFYTPIMKLSLLNYMFYVHKIKK